MRDHSYNGKTVREMPRTAILSCLENGIAVQISDETFPDREATYWIRLRLEVELVIRALLGETH